MLVDAKFLETDIHIAKGDLEKAGEILVQISNMVVGGDSVIINLKGRLSYYKGKIAEMQGDDETQIHSLRESIKYYELANSIDSSIRMTFTLLNHKYLKYNRIVSLELLRGVLDNIKKISNKEHKSLFEGRAYLRIGQILENVNDKEAVKSLEKAVKELNKAKNKPEEATALLTLARLNLLNNTKKAHELLSRAKVVAQDQNNRSLIGIVFLNQAMFDLIEDEEESANTNFDLAKTYFDQSSTDLDLGMDLLKIAIKGLFYTQSSLFLKKFRELLDITRSIFETLDNRAGKAIVKLVEIGYDFATGKLEEGQSQLALAKMLAKRFQGKNNLEIDERLLIYLKVANSVDIQQTDLYNLIMDAGSDFTDELIGEVLIYVGLFKIKTHPLESRFYMESGLSMFESLHSIDSILDNIDQLIEQIP